MSADLTLSLGDIALCVQVIDVCSRRGAIQGNELQLIGALRNRLAAIVDANKPAEEPAEGEASSSDAAGPSVIGAACCGGPCGGPCGGCPGGGHPCGGCPCGGCPCCIDGARGPCAGTAGGAPTAPPALFRMYSS